MSNPSNLQFSSLKLPVSTILSIINSYSVSNFVFSTYWPGPNQPLGLIAYAQTNGLNGILQYLALPTILTPLEQDPFVTDGPIILTNNYISIMQMTSLIQDANDDAYLLFTPGIFTGTLYIFYKIEIKNLLDNDQTDISVNTNPSPPAPFTIDAGIVM